MRRILTALTAVGLLGIAGSARAADDAKAVIEKAVAAHGGAAKLSAVKAIRAKGKGTITAGGMKIDFTADSVMLFPSKSREVINLEVMGQKITMIVVYDGKNAWIAGAGMDGELKGEKLADVRESIYSSQVSMLVPLLNDPAYKLTSLGDGKVGDADVTGVKVAREGFPDISLYVDKKTGLVLKESRMSFDEEAGKKVLTETIHGGFKDVNGVKVPTKGEVLKDGKLFMRAEVTDVEFPETVDEKEFKKPEN